MPAVNSSYGAGWTCDQCHVFVPTGVAHSHGEGTNTFTMIGPVNATPDALNRIAAALERLAEVAEAWAAPQVVIK